jgi:type II secretory pathway pseudopilin PulG
MYLRIPRFNNRGFTLLETLVAVGITVLLLGLLLANYRRSNENSLLERQVQSIMGQIRLAQETAAAGKTLEKYCDNNPSNLCNGNGDCGVGQVCTAKPPIGGEVVVFSCGANDTAPERTKYAWYGDTFSCNATCFTALVGGTRNLSDAIITGNTSGSPVTSDTPHAESPFLLESGTFIKDLRVVDSVNPNALYNCTNRSPWNGNPVPGRNSTPMNWPFQVAVRFIPPTGRQVAVSDNIAPGSVAGMAANPKVPWSKIEIMVGLKNRPKNCRIISITRDNVLTDRNDDDCNIAT